MAVHVTDTRSNPNEQIEHAVKVIGRSEARLKVFDAVYTGKKKIKTVTGVSQVTSLSSKRVLEEGKRLANNGLVIQTKKDGGTAYEKDQFFSASKSKILRLVQNPKGLDKLPTKSRPRVSLTNIVQIAVPRRVIQAKEIMIDDIDSFQKVRKITDTSTIKYIPVLERTFKTGVKKILKEKSTFKDWGGESNDLLTTRVTYKKRRYSTAFAFKGRGKSGKLTPAKMGKNGDQIQRLFRSPAQLFIVQYWGEIGENVTEQVQAFAQLKSVWEQKPIYFCLIDGIDSNRLMKAYSSCFRKAD